MARLTRELQRLDWLQGCALLQRLRLSRCEENVVHLGCVLNGCQKATKWAKALSLEGHELSVVCRASMISACGDSKQWRRSQELFGAMCPASKTSTTAL